MFLWLEKNFNMSFHLLINQPNWMKTKHKKFNTICYFIYKMIRLFVQLPTFLTSNFWVKEEEEKVTLVALLL